MPTFTNADLNVCEVVMNGIVASGGSNSRPSVSVWNFRRTATVLPVNETNIEAAFQASIGIAVTNALNARYTQSNNNVRIVNDARRVGVTVSRAVAGQVAGDSMPMDAALYLLFRVNQRGKGQHGGKHLFPMSESQTTTGTSDIWNAGALTLFGTLAAAFLAGFTDSDGNIWKPTLLRRAYSNLTAAVTAVTVDDIIAVLINKRVAKMTHRYVASVY